MNLTKVLFSISLSLSACTSSGPEPVNTRPDSGGNECRPGRYVECKKRTECILPDGFYLKVNPEAQTCIQGKQKSIEECAYYSYSNVPKQNYIRFRQQNNNIEYHIISNSSELVFDPDSDWKHCGKTEYERQSDPPGCGICKDIELQYEM